MPGKNHTDTHTHAHTPLCLYVCVAKRRLARHFNSLACRSIEENAVAPESRNYSNSKRRASAKDKRLKQHTCRLLPAEIKRTTSKR